MFALLETWYIIMNKKREFKVESLFLTWMLQVAIIAILESCALKPNSNLS